MNEGQWPYIRLTVKENPPDSTRCRSTRSGCIGGARRRLIGGRRRSCRILARQENNLRLSQSVFPRRTATRAAGTLAQGSLSYVLEAGLGPTTCRPGTRQRCGPAAPLVRGQLAKNNRQSITLLQCLRANTRDAWHIRG
jgi:hypothetical protein